MSDITVPSTVDSACSEVLPREITDSYPHAYESNGYSLLAKVRAETADLRFDLASKIIINSISISSGDKVIDLGGATGRLSRGIKNNAPEANIFNFELSFPDCKKSLEKREISTVTADICNIPIPDASVDKVVTTDVIEHIENGEKVIKEIARVLKPRGEAFIVIADPQDGRFDFVHDHIKRDPRNPSDVEYWTKILEKNNLCVDEKKSQILRDLDWRRIFNFPSLNKFKNYPIASCAFVPVLRPGTYIVRKSPL